MLSVKRIQELSSLPNVRTIGVRNFLGSLRGMSKNHALLNLASDARSYRWSPETVRAIETGIEEFYSTK